MAEKASFASRLFAYVLDWLALALITMLVVIVGGFFFAVAQLSDPGFVRTVSLTLGALVWVLLSLLAFIYFGIMWSRDGQSLGMRWLGVKVVRQDGGPLGFWRAALRGSLGYTISGLFFGLGFLWAAFDSEGETWHDKLFDTRVISEY